MKILLNFNFVNFPGVKKTSQLFPAVSLENETFLD